MSNVLSLRFLMDEGRFIKHPFNPDAPLGLPSFTQGDVVPVRLYAYARTAGNQSRIVPQNISSAHAELSMGSAGEHPELGFWFLSFGADTSGAIPAQTYEAEVSTILNAVTSLRNIGGVDVAGTPCNFILTCRAVGAQTLPTVTYQGEVLANVRVSEVNAGDANSPAQWRVQIFSAAPASNVAWQPATLTPSSTVESLGNNLWRVSLDEFAEGGYFKLAISAAPSAFISLYASPIEIQTALAAIAGNLGQGAQVIPDQSGEGSFILALGNSNTLTIDDSALQIPPSLLGSLDLTGDGITELLDGAFFLGVTLSVKTDGMWTNADAAVILRRSNSPMPTSSSTIPNPPIGTPVSQTRYLASVTGLTGGGPTNLDGVYTVQLPMNSLVKVIIPGPPDIEQEWELQTDPAYPTASDPANGIVAPLDASSMNQRLWIERR